MEHAPEKVLGQRKMMGRLKILTFKRMTQPNVKTLYVLVRVLNFSLPAIKAFDVLIFSSKPLCAIFFFRKEPLCA